MSEFFRPSPDGCSASGNSNSNKNTNNDDNDGNRENSNSVLDSRGGTSRQHQEPQQQQDLASPSRADPRVRSESCTDELLATGRGKTKEAVGSSAGVDVKEGEGLFPSAAEKTVADRGTSVGEGLGGVGARSSVPRSQSLDLGAADGGRGSRRGSLLAQEEDFSRKKVRARVGCLRVFCERVVLSPRRDRLYHYVEDQRRA